MAAQLYEVPAQHAKAIGGIRRRMAMPRILFLELPALLVIATGFALSAGHAIVWKLEKEYGRTWGEEQHNFLVIAALAVGTLWILLAVFFVVTRTRESFPFNLFYCTECRRAEETGRSTCSNCAAFLTQQRKYSYFTPEELRATELRFRYKYGSWPLKNEGPT